VNLLVTESGKFVKQDTAARDNTSR